MKNDVLFKAIKQILWFIQDLNPVLLAPSLTCALHHIPYRSITSLLTVLFSLLLGYLPTLQMVLNHQSLLEIPIQRHHPTITHIHDPQNHNLWKITNTEKLIHSLWVHSSSPAFETSTSWKAHKTTLRDDILFKLCKRLEFKKKNKELPFSSSWRELTLVNLESVPLV